MNAELVNRPRRARHAARGDRWPSASPGNCPTPPAPMPPDRPPTCASVTPSAHRSVPGIRRQARAGQVDVHLWYPADQQGLSDSAQDRLPVGAVRPNRSAAVGPAFLAGRGRDRARRRADRSATAKPFPVIVFSHGSTNDPIDYAHTLELIAGAGFVVAAPYHVNNTQDDARIDYINQRSSARSAQPAAVQCSDGRPLAVLAGATSR